MKSRFDLVMNGVNLGLLGPVAGACIYYWMKFPHIPFDRYLDFASQLDVAPKVLAFSSLMNLGIFFLFIWGAMYRAARGVIFSTFFYGALIIGLIVADYLLR